MRRTAHSSPDRTAMAITGNPPERRVCTRTRSGAHVDMITHTDTQMDTHMDMDMDMDDQSPIATDEKTVGGTKRNGRMTTAAGVHSERNQRSKPITKRLAPTTRLGSIEP